MDKNTAAFIAGKAYGARMTFARYMRMLAAFTNGRIPLNPKDTARNFITGAYRGFIQANPGVSIR